ncbi:hypothetical protein SAMN05444714_1991 [Yoonia litorea]|uniref:Uncharacterized protein n=1 Tax=Yoonia litorea TaxID=1123755 RepID=A0A1I6ML99_9RHOB|nr:hypothetical protein SAMN05444714_1991 [Yoonia litorea]
MIVSDFLHIVGRSVAEAPNTPWQRLCTTKKPLLGLLKKFHVSCGYRLDAHTDQRLLPRDLGYAAVGGAICAFNAAPKRACDG